MSDGVRMKYTGPHSGSMSFTVNNTSYRAGRFEPFIDAAPDDVAGLEATGVFAAVAAPLDAEAQSSVDMIAALGEPLATTLQAAGYSTIPGTAHHLSQAADDDLIALEGVGRATLAKIREAYPSVSITPPTDIAQSTTVPAERVVGPGVTTTPTDQDSALWSELPSPAPFAALDPAVASALTAAGYHESTVASIHDADLLALDGIGKATLAKIREAYPV